MIEKEKFTAMDHRLWTMDYFCSMTEFLETSFNKQDYDKDSFFLMAGPCVVESEELVMEVAAKVKEICQRHRIPLIFKSSYRKANRTSATSFTGLGDETGLEIIRKTGEKFGLATVTDIHTER